jgi:hypothetical protein
MPSLDFQTGVTHGPGAVVIWYIGGLSTMREFSRAPETTFKRADGAEPFQNP